MTKYFLTLISVLLLLSACDNSDDPADNGPDEFLKEMKEALHNIDVAQIDVEYFLQIDDNEPYQDEFYMLMKRDSSDPAVSAKIMIEPYNRFSGFLLTYVDGKYMAIDSVQQRVSVTEKEMGGADKIRKDYRGDIAAVYFDKLYEFIQHPGTNFIDTDTFINGQSYHRLISVKEDKTNNSSNTLIWYIDSETMLPMEWSRIFTRNDTTRFENVEIKSINTQLNLNDLAFQITYPDSYDVELKNYQTNEDVYKREFLPNINIGDTVPPFLIKTKKGKSLSDKEILGKPTVIKFWGTWCDYCKKSLPQIRTVYDRYQDSVNIVMISTREKGNTDPQGYLELMNYPFETYLKGDSLSTEYKITGFPTVFLTDTNGIIIKRFVGYDPELDKKLISTIEEQL